jgi:hypothetical protein
MKKKGPEYGAAKEAARVAEMVATLPTAPKRAVSTVQAQSTIDAEAMSPQERRLRPTIMPHRPEGYRFPTTQEEIDRLVGFNPGRWRPEEFAHFESRRRAPKNKVGATDAPSLSPERKEKAMQAFQFSGSVPPEQVDPAKVTGIAPIISQDPVLFVDNPGFSAMVKLQPAAPLTRFQRIRNWVLTPFFAWIPDSWKDDI